MPAPRPHIPPPQDDFEVTVEDDREATCPEGQSNRCRSAGDRGKVVSDLITMADPRWLHWAVGEALAGRAPRTEALLVPSVSGGGALDLGTRSRLRRPMCFGGQAHREGDACEPGDPRDVPLALALRRRSAPAGVVLLESWEFMRWPAYRVRGGST